MRDAFLAMVAHVRAAVSLNVIADMIEKGEWVKAFEMVMRGAPNILARASEQAFIDAARDTAKVLNRAFGEVVIDFDLVNERAINAMRGNRLRLVTAINNQQRETIRTAILEGMQEGMNPRDIARRFRDSIGLTPNQQRAVDNYRKALSGLDRRALERALRDKRFDSTVLNAIESGKKLDAAQINKMVGRYYDRMLKYRSEVIARTEALRAVHQGAETMYLQAIDEGELSADQLTREWNTAKDERVRGSHRAMHGQVQPFGQPFISGKGNALRYPGDPEAPPEETIQCRCSVGTRMTTAKRAMA